ncbi:MAG TPA: hypothetical protein VFW29_06620 [Solirubrobacteraceae bacterium]|nr:hypothetical protein [Solirubrobacteraceae bacterium]
MRSPLPPNLTRNLVRLAAAATLLGALLLSLAGAAGARSSACASQKRSTRACAQSRPHHKASKHARHHHAKTKAPKPKKPVRLAPACEDGSTPTTISEESTCADGSEAQCPAATAPTFAPDGSIAYCTPERLAAAAPVEASEPTDESDSSACDDGSTAAMDGEGAYSCDDGSEPQCPEPTLLTLSESGSALVCEASEEGA